MKYSLLIAIYFLSCASVATTLPSSLLNQVTDLENQGKISEALTILEQYKDHNSTSSTYDVAMAQAPLLRKKGHYNEAIELLLPLQKIANLSKEDQYQIQKELGINYRRQVKTIEAKKHYMAALALANELEDKNLQAQSHSNLGSLYDTLNDLEQSMHHQVKAQGLLENSDNYELVATNFYNLANLAQRLDDLSQSEYFYKKALEFDIKTKNQMNIADTSLQLAKLVYKRGDLEQALPLLNNAYTRLADVNAYENMATAKHTLMQLYLKIDNQHMALSSAESGLNAALKSGSTLSKIYSYFNLIELHLALKNPILINLYLSNTKELLADIDNRLLNQKQHGYTAIYAELIGDYKLAAEQLKLKNTLAESLFEEHLNQAVERNKKQLTAIEQQQRIDDEIQKNKLATAQMNNQRLEKQIWLLSAGIVLLFSTLALVLYYFKHRKALFKAKLYQYSLIEKDKMLADISHELRTPLSVLKLHIEALELDIQENRDLAYSKINGKIAQLNNLISDVYQLSQAENKTLTLNLQQYNAAHIFTEYEQDMRRYVCSHQLTFLADIVIAEGVEITVDKQKLDQILNNIFTNACLYTDSPGHVRLKVRANNQELFIQVDDTSPGVGKAHIGKLFDRLYRVEESRSRALGGSGLGLSICQSFVELMSGNISALPGKSGGLCIRILLPISNKQALSSPFFHHILLLKQHYKLLWNGTMSESLKHAQWAKSVERKHRQNKVKKTKKSHLPFSAAIASLLLSAGLYYISYEKPVASPPLSESAKQRISQFYAKQFLLGHWRLNKIKYSTNAIQVYVQTPTPIALEGEALSQYLHYALCPLPSKQIWQDIQSRELSVYVFSHSVRKGERTVCNKV